MAEEEPFPMIGDGIRVRVADYMITARCNLDCPFCYGPDPKMRGELGYGDVIRLIEFFGDQGVGGVVFAGGEPLLSPHLLGAVECAKSLGMQVGLQTNGTVLSRLRKVLPLLDWIGLPIDGVKRSTAATLRTLPDHVATIIAAYRLAEPWRAHGLRVKIGTVVTPANLNELPDIAQIVRDIHPDVWKWYQVRPRGAGRSNYMRLYVPAEQIVLAAVHMQQLVPSLPTPTVSLVGESNNAYLIVNPDSELLIPRDEKYRSCGRLISSTGELDPERWQDAIAVLDSERHSANIDKTFPGSFK